MNNVMNMINDPSSFEISLEGKENLSAEISNVLARRFNTLRDIKTFIENIDIEGHPMNTVSPIRELLTYVETNVKEEYREETKKYLNTYREILDMFTVFPVVMILMKIITLYCAKKAIESLGEEFCPSNKIPPKDEEMLNDAYNTGMCIGRLLIPDLMLGKRITFPQYNSEMRVKKQSYHDTVRYITEEHSYLLSGEYIKGCSVM